MMKINTSFLLRFMRFWPPFWGAGIRVKEFSPDYKRILVEMKLRFWNANYVGAHFGGSLYSMTDPFYMLMLLNILKKDYIIWDKSASIRYKKPAYDTVYAEFILTDDRIQEIKDEVELHSKATPEFNIKIVDKNNELIAEVNKIISVKKKEKQKEFENKN